MSRGRADKKWVWTCAIAVLVFGVAVLLFVMSLASPGRRDAGQRSGRPTGFLEWLLRKNPQYKSEMQMLENIERLFENMDPGQFEETGCFVWTAGVDSEGFGTFDDEDGKTLQVHRWLFLHGNRSDPADVDLEHTCTTARCVNPEHVRVSER